MTIIIGTCIRKNFKIYLLLLVGCYNFIELLDLRHSPTSIPRRGKSMCNVLDTAWIPCVTYVLVFTKNASSIYNIGLLTAIGRPSTVLAT